MRRQTYRKLTAVARTTQNKSSILIVVPRSVREKKRKGEERVMAAGLADSDTRKDCLPARA